jgi:ribonuclease P protein subunit POP4
MITIKNLLKHELIGLEVEVVQSGNKSEHGIKGEVVNETKNTFVIQTGKRERTIQKDGRKFVFSLDGQKIKINGSEIVRRPEDRIKKKVRKWH